MTRDPFYPWNRPELQKWSIVGMNHYLVDGERHLFVAMTFGGRAVARCIQAEGKDEARVFEDLALQATSLLAERNRSLDEALNSGDGSYKP